MFLHFVLVFVLVAYLITIGVMVVVTKNLLRGFHEVFEVGTGVFGLVISWLVCGLTIGFTVLYWIIPTSILSIEGWFIYLFTIHLAYTWFRLLAYLRRVQKPESPHRN